MWVNEEEIVGIPNALLILVKNRLKKLGKQLLSEILKDISSLNFIYQPINILKRISTVSLPTNLDINPLSFFHIFLFMSNCNLISTHTNINAIMK